VEAFINLVGVEASISPTGSSNRGSMLVQGFPKGVTLHFVAGNNRGKSFAETLAQALCEQGVTASAIDDASSDALVDHQIKGAPPQGVHLTRDSKEFKPVVRVVGDKL